ncbi:MAG: glycosyltransferase [Candidatus Thermoplasmatota archaeon]|nr:glycosyltransferase [Candidatus Thermoplasmatota archaeon]
MPAKQTTVAKHKKDTILLFVGNRKSSFINNDFKILQQHFVTKYISLSASAHPILFLPIFIIKTLFFVKSSDVVFCWFANYESFLPILFSRAFKKKSIVVAGGYDCASEPSLSYGAFSNPIKKIPTQFVLNHADTVLAVSKFTQKEALLRSTPNQLQTLYNGIDTEKFKPLSLKKEKIVVTVGNATKQGSKIKGLETFAKASVHFPDYKFVIIGSTEESTVQYLKKINPNLHFTGRLPHETILTWFQQAAVYCQLSLRESFGVALAEAMSCHCIPVITDQTALPETVGKNGFYVSYGDVEGTINAINKAFEAPNDLRQKVRKRTIQLFSLDVREKKLIRMIGKF